MNFRSCEGKMLKHRWFAVGTILAAAVGYAAVPAASQEAAKPASEIAEKDQPNIPPQNVGGIEDKSGGEISGIIRFKGTKPQAKPIIEIAGNAFCKKCFEGKELPVRDNIGLGKNGNDDAVQNVLVYVSKGLEGKKFDPPTRKVVLDQVDCIYTPHVV